MNFCQVKHADGVAGTTLELLGPHRCLYALCTNPTRSSAPRNAEAGFSHWRLVWWSLCSSRTRPICGFVSDGTRRIQIISPRV